MNSTKNKKKLLFILLAVFVVAFFLWSQLFWISLSLLIISEVLSTNITVKFLKQTLNKSVFNIIKLLGFLVFPVGFAIFIRTFFFDVYYVPSSSMERTLLPNDYVLVNKFLFGAKVPNYSSDIPVIGNFFKTNGPKNTDLYKSLKAFKVYSREDIVVFKSTDNHAKFLVKRIIGLPGDTLQIKKTKVYINQSKLGEKDNYSYNYIDDKNRAFQIYSNLSNNEYNTLSVEEKSKLQKVNDSISSSYFIFPSAKQSEWSRDNYGPLIIPRKGQKIRISSANYSLYKTIIKKFEDGSFKLKKGEQKEYIFKNNYFFMLGDNRHNSIDSRSFGFIPESYIQGKVIQKL